MKNLTETEAKNIEALAKKSKKLASAVLEKMHALGVRRLANVYMPVQHSHTHGTQYQLHIDGDDTDADLNRSGIDSTADRFCDFGDFNLQFSYPTLDTVLAFLASINEINDAINEINKGIETALLNTQSVNV